MLFYSHFFPQNPQNQNVENYLLCVEMLTTVFDVLMSIASIKKVNLLKISTPAIKWFKKQLLKTLFVDISYFACMPSRAC